jgi:hypothetical protein
MMRYDVPHPFCLFPVNVKVVKEYIVPWGQIFILDFAAIVACSDRLEENVEKGLWGQACDIAISLSSISLISSFWFFWLRTLGA